MLRLIPGALLFGAGLLLPTAAAAQDLTPPLPPLDERIAPFVVDARIAIPRFKPSAAVAGSLGVTEDDLPGRGLGLVVGAHGYPIRVRSFALGLGGELMLRARATSTIEPAVVVEDGPDGPTIVTRMTSISPQVSLNFGRRTGYSYLTGGFGLGSFTTELEDSPVGDAETRPKILNYGGGARWFTRRRLAFAIDLRFYKIGAQEPAAQRPAYPASTTMVFSAGISTR